MVDTEAYVEAGRRMAELGDCLASSLCGRSFGRSLFTNAHPELGPLNTHIQAMAAMIRQVWSIAASDAHQAYKSCAVVAAKDNRRARPGHATPESDK
jgi:hypothetical protein